MAEIYTPEKILKSGRATIVFWKDGSKTIVKLPAGEESDDYSAFTAALAKKIYGSNSAIKKVIVAKTVVQDKKEKFPKVPFLNLEISEMEKNE